MLDVLKVILLGIVEGITEWLPVSSTGHLILVGNVLKPGLSDAFMEMFNVVIQLGAIMAVVVLYFHKLNPFSPKKTQKQKLLTWQMWIKVLIACVPAAVVGLLFDDILDKIFYKPLPVAVMLIVYGVLFIIVENRNEGRKPAVRRISELDIKMLLWIGAFQMLAPIPGTSRSGATIVGALIIGVSREVAAEFTFFLGRFPRYVSGRCRRADFDLLCRPFDAAQNLSFERPAGRFFVFEPPLSKGGAEPARRRDSCPSAGVTACRA